jgi:hypothetical protein
MSTWESRCRRLSTRRLRSAAIDSRAPAAYATRRSAVGLAFCSMEDTLNAAQRLQHAAPRRLHRCRFGSYNDTEEGCTVWIGLMSPSETKP